MIVYTRLYSDAHGESHFEDIEIDLTLTEGLQEIAGLPRRKDTTRGSC